MYISRVVIRNFRNFVLLDASLQPGVTCVVGENNLGKTNLLHAIRLVVDADLSSRYRQLLDQDVNSRTDLSLPGQVLVSLEFSDFADHANEFALVCTCQDLSVDPPVARLTYRFRPRQSFRDLHEQGEEIPVLSLEDYQWELVGGGDKDPTEVLWFDPYGSSVRFADLQYYRVVFLPALRDVDRDLGQSRMSPLARLLNTDTIPEAERTQLVGILRGANEQIAARPSIAATGEAISAAFRGTTGEAYAMGVALGVADPSFSSITSALTLLLSDATLANFSPDRNGLGLNNLLYISMLLEYFRRRISEAKTAGQLLLVEEPEAHLHPQLQRVLYAFLSQEGFQSILTTHSTHITSQAPLDSLVVITRNPDGSPVSATPVSSGHLTECDVADLERFLDATRSDLLFARKVILVEGPAELFLLPPLVRKVMGIDLDRRGISVVAIHGTHFGVYAKLFSDMAMPKRCAIVADGDLAPSLSAAGDEDDAFEPPDLSVLANEYVGVFRCETTFERAVTIPGTLLMLSEAAQEIGAPRVADALRRAHDELEHEQDTAKRKAVVNPLRQRVLNTAVRFGKARFAQLASKHVSEATSVPKYIKDAVNWLLDGA